MPELIEGKLDATGLCFAVAKSRPYLLSWWKQRVPGHARKDVIFVAPDFDKMPDDFNE